MAWKLALCEDDSLFLERLCLMIETWLQERNYPAHLFCYDTTMKLLGAIENLSSFDAYFLDIETPCSLSGLELAETIRESDKESPIIFVTSHSELAHLGYNSNALNYLIKPVDEAMLCPVMERLALRLHQQKQTDFICRIEGELRHLRYRDIYCFCSQAHHVLINDDPLLRFRMKLDELEQLLPRNFLRIHKSTIINMEHIYQMRASRVVMEDERRSTYTISSGYRKQAQDFYHDYFSNHRPVTRLV